jgi:hypothetical protein
MNSIKLQSHIGKDRILQILLPEGVENKDLDIVLAYRESTPEISKRRGKSIWQLSEDFIRDIPPEELSQLPSDGADQHDHYIYGIPKKEV